MRLTTRGWAVVAVVAAAFAVSLHSGPRALDAVVVPLLVVLVAGVVTTRFVDRPRVDRRPVDDGFPGESRTATITVESDAAVAATVRDAVPPTLSTDDAPVVETTLEGETTLSYDLALTARGEYALGPLSITVTDAFGLVARRFADEATTTVRVYPPVDRLGGDVAREVRVLADGASGTDRDEFDHLRAYRRGDSPRDVHWKATARRPDEDLVVAERRADGPPEAVTVAVEGPPERADDLAAVAASVVRVLFEAGVDVGLAVGETSRPPAAGRPNYRDLLGVLAGTDAGPLPSRERERADVLVEVDDAATRVVIDGTELTVDVEGAESDGADSGASGGAGASGGPDDGDDRSEVVA